MFRLHRLLSSVASGGQWWERNLMPIKLVALRAKSNVISLRINDPKKCYFLIVLRHFEPKQGGTPTQGGHIYTVYPS